MTVSDSSNSVPAVPGSWHAVCAPRPSCIPRFRSRVLWNCDRRLCGCCLRSMHATRSRQPTGAPPMKQPGRNEQAAPQGIDAGPSKAGTTPEQPEPSVIEHQPSKRPRSAVVAEPAAQNSKVQTMTRQQQLRHKLQHAPDVAALHANRKRLDPHVSKSAALGAAANSKLGARKAAVGARRCRRKSTPLLSACTPADLPDDVLLLIFSELQLHRCVAAQGDPPAPAPCSCSSLSH